MFTSLFTNILLYLSFTHLIVKPKLRLNFFCLLKKKQVARQYKFIYDCSSEHPPEAKSLVSHPQLTLPNLYI